jgi:two-component sensor histidine kinase
MRRLVATVVAGWAVDAVMLAASEITTNAVKYGEPASPDVVRATVSQQFGTVSVEVVGRGRFAPGEHQRQGPGGFGLAIVDEVASDWGVEQDGADVRVWFTVESDDPRNAN